MRNLLFHKCTKFVALLFTILFSFSNIQSAAIFDTTFGTNGTVIIPPDQFNPYVKDVAFLNDGRFIVLGVGMIRFNNNGTIDSSFGNNGIAAISGNAISISLQTDGKIVLAGYVYDSIGVHTDFFLSRHNSNGTLDQTFGNNGVVTLNQSSRDTFQSAKIQNDGKIVAVGQQNDDGQFGCVIRFNSNGSLDRDFANGGLFYYRFPTESNTQYNGFYDVEISHDGKILTNATTGIDLPGTVYDRAGYFLLMLNQQGQIFSGFGNGGIATGDVSGSNTGFPNDGSIEILPDNKIFVSDAWLARTLNADGSVFKSCHLAARNYRKCLTVEFWLAGD